MKKTLHFIIFNVTILSGAFAFGAAQSSHRWVGPDYFAIPLHDWAVEEGKIAATPAAFGGGYRGAMGARLYATTRLVKQQGTLKSSFTIQLQKQANKNRSRAGLWLGLKSQTPSTRNVWIHPVSESALFVGVDEQGYVRMGEQTSSIPVPLDQATYFEIEAMISDKQTDIRLHVKPARGKTFELIAQHAPDIFQGFVCLSAFGNGSKWVFDQWKLEGDALEYRPDYAVGPILWTQYTLSNQTVKLQAQFVPLEKDDVQEAVLELKRNGRWEKAAETKIEPLSSTALFRLENWDDTKAIDYRVLYFWQGNTYSWKGLIRANPQDRKTFKLGVFNCDHGELFPQDTMVRNVTLQNPDMLFFAGDQIYEIMDNVRIIRKPLKAARLSYLSKWYQFGLTWRSLLKDRPSVIIPDDHDVFMGNIWGDNGRGYVMEPAWVNMVQRTQTGSLPDPADPAPVERGIDVYFTRLDYAGMSFAVIEDRKFKSKPTFPKGFSRKQAKAKDYDLPGARLLGERQLTFLKKWNQNTRHLPVRWFLSQTMFAKAHTHAGPALKQDGFDVDSNGWPQSGRNRALQAIDRNIIMVHGDQHIGVLARMGIEDWEDGPWAFMVTGSSVGFPRAWWPGEKAQAGEINGPYTGRFFDHFGNRITIYGVTNPKPVEGQGKRIAYERPDLKDQGVFGIQAGKGSGHGMVVVNKNAREATFQAYRLDFDAAHAKSSDQFAGFPYTIKLNE